MLYVFILKMFCASVGQIEFMFPMSKDGEAGGGAGLGRRGKLRVARNTKHCCNGGGGRGLKNVLYK